MKFLLFFRKKKTKIIPMSLELTKLELPWENFYFIAMSIKLGSYFYSNILIQDIYDVIKNEPFNDMLEIILRLLSIFSKRDQWIRIQPIQNPINLFEYSEDRILINHKYYYIEDVEYFLQFNQKSFELITN